MEREQSTFLDAINPMVVRLSRKQREERLNVCRACENFTRLSTCSLCHCVMPLKVGLPDAECPIQKWLKYPSS